MDIRIQQLTEGDWQTFAHIRSIALQSDPGAFGSNYEREAKFTEENWRIRLRDGDTAIFLLSNETTAFGITGVSVDRNDATRKTAILWGSWLASEYRGKNLSDLMYRTRIEWAKARPAVEKILVSHRVSNLVSKRANQKHGFIKTHCTENLWADGTTEDIVTYELRITTEFSELKKIAD